MKKTIIFITSVALLVVLAIGFVHATTIYFPAPLRIWQRDDLALLMGEETFDETKFWIDMDDPITYQRNRFYGEYNGYFVISEPSPAQWIVEENVGGYKFVLNARGIGVCKGSKSYSLSAAYELGIISDKDLAKIYAYHMQIEDELGILTDFI